MGKYLGSQLFNVNEHLTISCRSESTRYGFRHLATLMRDGWAGPEAKECYYNRTWERYEFQTVIRGLASKVSAAEAQIIQEFADNYQEDNNALRTVGMIAAMGALLMDNPSPAETNDWKLRMVKAGLPALDVPDDWDALDEGEKTRRLDAVIAELRQ